MWGIACGRSHRSWHVQNELIPRGIHTILMSCLEEILREPISQA